MVYTYLYAFAENMARHALPICPDLEIQIQYFYDKIHLYRQEVKKTKCTIHDHKSLCQVHIFSIFFYFNFFLKPYNLLHDG